MSKFEVENDFNDIINIKLQIDDLPKEELAISEEEKLKLIEKLDYLENLDCCVCPTPTPTPPPPPCTDDCSTTIRIHYKPCEFFKKVQTKPIDLNKCTDRLLKVKVTIKNVCLDKEISVGVILCDCHGIIIAFKVFTAILHKDLNSSCYKACGTLRRKLSFTIPNSDICCPLDLTARVIANYTTPCDFCDPCSL